jgi:hypothetical protein
MRVGEEDVASVRWDIRQEARIIGMVVEKKIRRCRKQKIEINARKSIVHCPKSFAFDPFFRRKFRGTDKTWLIVPFRWAPDSGTLARFRLLSRRSERRLCMRCIATPFSSVEKSKPRWTERIPVDMSVLLAERWSIEGRGTDAILSVCVSETIDVGRRRFRALKVPCSRTRGSCVRSL